MEFICIVKIATLFGAFLVDLYYNFNIQINITRIHCTPNMYAIQLHTPTNYYYIQAIGKRQ